MSSINNGMNRRFPGVRECSIVGAFTEAKDQKCPEWDFANFMDEGRKPVKLYTGTRHTWLETASTEIF